MKCLVELLKVDEHWIPTGDGYSLYLRPTTIATDPFLGVGMASECKFFIITCPVGPYYPSGFKPIKLLADDKNVRAWPGGCGSSKLGGNYAPTIAPQMSAVDAGCAQVLWLYPTGDDHIVTEVGAMNLFFVIKKADGSGVELVTAPLTDGTILPGVTRRSVLELARQSGEFTVSERPLGMKEIIKASKEGRLMEAFGAGTAAVIAPVNEIHYKGQDIKFPTGAEIGPVGKSMWNKILDIQYGRVEHPWSVVVN
jgi:branched-chain amino acid aminotransferase